MGRTICHRQIPLSPHHLWDGVKENPKAQKRGVESIKKGGEKVNQRYLK